MSEKQEGELKKRTKGVINEAVKDGFAELADYYSDLNTIVNEAKAEFPKIDEYGYFFEADGDKQAIIWYKKWFGKPTNL